MPELTPPGIAAGDDKAVKLSELKLAAVDRPLALDAGRAASRRIALRNQRTMAFD